MTFKRAAAGLGVAIFAMALVGCESDASGPGEPMVEAADLLQVAHHDDVLFLSRTEPTTTAPDALFEGQMTIDEAGCIRLETTGEVGVTAVWPHGFTLERDGETLRVHDDTDAAVATVGALTRLGGGQVDQLGPDLGFTTNDQELANARCPGKYWFVADVL